MEFLKKIFDDDSTKVGLCAFERIQPLRTATVTKTPEAIDFFNPFADNFNQTINFTTNISNNNLLSF